MKKTGERFKAKGPRFFTLNLSPALKAFANLDTPNLKIDTIWREEAQKRWQAYKAGELKTVSSANCSCIALPPASMQSYEAVMQKYQ
ncbi:MAG TPA: addiction module protein [Methylobacter sp.]